MAVDLLAQLGPNLASAFLCTALDGHHEAHTGLGRCRLVLLASLRTRSAQLLGCFPRSPAYVGRHEVVDAVECSMARHDLGRHWMRGRGCACRPRGCRKRGQMVGSALASCLTVSYRALWRSLPTQTHGVCVGSGLDSRWAGSSCANQTCAKRRINTYLRLALPPWLQLPVGHVVGAVRESEGRQGRTDSCHVPSQGPLQHLQKEGRSD